MNHEQVLNNRAERTAEPPEEVICPTCDEPVIFALQDKHHKFSLGLRTVLECLCFAENQGYVPSLPDGWWTQIESVYQLNLHPVEGVKDECIQAENNGLGIQSD